MNKTKQLTGRDDRYRGKERKHIRERTDKEQLTSTKLAREQSTRTTYAKDK